MISGTDLARQFPDTAVRVFYTCAREGGDVRNAWDVLVSAHGPERASQLVRDGRPADADLGDITITHGLHDYVTPPLPPRPLPKCDSPVCEGHLGRFQDCRTEALYNFTLDGSYGDSTGDTDAYGYFTVLTFGDYTHEPLGTGPVLSARIVTIPPGHYIVECQSSGAVYSTSYDTAEAALAAFTEHESAYDLWANDDNDDEDDD